MPNKAASVGGDKTSEEEQGEKGDSVERQSVLR